MHVGEIVRLHEGCENNQRAIFLFYAPLPVFPVLYLKLCFCLIFGEILRGNSYVSKFKDYVIVNIVIFPTFYL